MCNTPLIDVRREADFVMGHEPGAANFPLEELAARVHELPPRDILARHPHVFSDIAAVYAAKRNLMTRLQRSPELRAMRYEHNA